ncbi:cornulin-like [Tympanuchus pallidicinctus]|uniref:cornulin-like n=1 Tax=Tympanuchus pallidicinctus TaxID=109042 RepID=UPI0022874093|nr:cornulin-like [Tympanuchus pallidicinctus]
MAQLQENINGIITTFYAYASSDGDCRTLSRGELRQLIEQEFEDVIMDARDPRTVEKVLLFLDEDSSGKVDFNEFLNLVFRVARACHRQLQHYLDAEDDQELTVQEEADGEQHHKQVLEEGVSGQVQEGGTPQKDQDTQQHQEGKEPKKHQGTQQNKGDGTPKNQDTQKIEKSETPKVQETQKTQEVEAPKNNQGTQQKQKNETPKEIHQDDRAKAQEEGPKRGENVVTETSEKDRNTPKAEKTPKHDPTPHQDKITETPKLGQSHHQRQELDTAEHSHTSPTKTSERTVDKTKDHAAHRQDPSPKRTQELPPPVSGTSPHPDPQASSGIQHNPAHLPDPTVTVREGSGVEVERVPGQQQHGAHGKGKHAAEQEHLQPQWPPKK